MNEDTLLTSLKRVVIQCDKEHICIHTAVRLWPLLTQTPFEKAYKMWKTYGGDNNSFGTVL